ncbi:MAG: ParA family protein [Bacteroidetes bacterium]|nr:ParA family protein [Bacteroidota bacterium]MCY4205950.1 ParA family protein [Bacteroidota bacterium]
MAVISVCNHKGGTGKTTTSIHIAAALKLVGYKTLVVDLDPQGYLTCTMDINSSDIVHASGHLFQPNTDLSDVEPLQLPAFDLLPSGDGMNRHAGKLTSVTDLFWIKEALQHQSIYDVIILDTAAAVSVYVLNAMISADILLIPVTPELQSIHGASQTWNTAKEVRKKWNPGLKKAMFLLTNVHGRKNIHRQYSQYMRQKYDNLVMDTVIRTCSSLSEISREGRTIFDTHLTSRGAKDYAATVDELIRYALPSEEKYRGT